MARLCTGEGALSASRSLSNSGRFIRLVLPKISDRGVAEHPTSGQMLHPNRKLRLAPSPLYVRQSPGLKPSPRGLETLYLREKLCPCISTKSDKRRSDVNHACAFRMGEQSP